MQTPYFKGDNRYRYEIVVNDQCTLKRGELISAIHKLTRQGLDGELYMLLEAFFTAVASDDCNRLKGAITQVVNRVAIAFIEDGPILNSTEVDRDRIVDMFVLLYDFARQGEWDGCINACKELCGLIVGVRRGRLGSVALSYIKHGRYFSDENATALYVQEMLDPDNMFTNGKVSLADVRQVVEYNMPELGALLDVDKFANCDEARRQLYLAAVVSRAARAELVSTAPATQVLTRAMLHSIGALDDIHTKGRGSSRGWDVFLEKGMRVANPTSACLFGKSYAELEQLYADGKRVEFLASQETKSPACGKKRTLKDTGSSPSKKNKTEAELPDGALCFEGEDELISIEESVKLGGFKNGTLIGACLKQPLGPLSAGSRVFFKMGEPLENVEYSVRCSEWQAELGLASTTQTVVWVKPHPEWWSAICNRFKSVKDEKWGACMQKGLALRIKKHSRQGYMPCLVAEHFNGVRGTEYFSSLPSEATLMQLAKVLLFSRYVGITDTSLFNMLVCDEGRVLQVDMGKPDFTQLSKYLPKGLQTSHKLPKTIFGPLMKIVIKNSGEIASFMRRIMESSAKSNYTTPPPPFHEETIAALERGDANRMVAECIISVADDTQAE